MFYKIYFEVKPNFDMKLLNDKEKLLKRLQELEEKLEETVKTPCEYLQISSEKEDCQLALEMLNRNISI